MADAKGDDQDDDQRQQEEEQVVAKFLELDGETVLHLHELRLLDEQGEQ